MIKMLADQKDFNHHKNAWSNRVEAIWELQFSLVGDVVDTQQEPVYGLPSSFFARFFFV